MIRAPFAACAAGGPCAGRRQRGSPLWNPIFACGRDGRSHRRCRAVPAPPAVLLAGGALRRNDIRCTHSPPQRRKGVQRDKSLWRCLRKTARRVGETNSSLRTQMPSASRISFFSRAPTIRPARSPLRKNSMVGMLMMPKRAASVGCSSTLTVQIFTCPEDSCSSSFRRGASVRQCGQAYGDR